MRLHKCREKNVDTILSSNALPDGLRQDLCAPMLHSLFYGMFCNKVGITLMHRDLHGGLDVHAHLLPLVKLAFLLFLHCS